MADLISLRSQSAPQDDEFRGRIGRARGERGGTSGKLGARLTKAMKGAPVRASAFTNAGPVRGFSGDQRQRVVAKVSFHKHGFGGAAGGGGGRLMAHAQYLERDGAAREGERGQFYDQEPWVLDEPSPAIWASTRRTWFA
jgi:hypothetical protein